MARMRKARRNGILAGVLGFVALVSVVALFMSTSDMQVLSPVGDQDSKSTQCSAEVTPELTLSGYDGRNPGSSLTGHGVYRKEGTIGWTDFKTGNAISGLECGENYEIVVGANSTSQTDFTHGQSIIYNVPNKESVTKDMELSQNEVEGDLTTTFYNADGDAAAETFSAGQTQDVELKFLSDVDQFFGNPYLDDSKPNGLCLDLNSTAWDKPESVRYDGQELSSVETPQRHSGSTSTNTYCYEAPVIDDSDNRITLKLNADDSNAPAYDDTAYLYAADFFINSETGEMEVGVEDEEGTAVGTAGSASVTLDFTS